LKCRPHPFERTALDYSHGHQAAERKLVTSVNFAISVGTRVPRSLHFYRVPMELVQINPRWRGYDYFLVGEQIIVVHPRTHEIVAVLDA
jgi:hypothetical protein